MREQFAHAQRGEHAAWNLWRHNFGVDSRLHCVVPFGTAGMVHVRPVLRAKRGAPKYTRSEPVLCLGYQHIYSDVCRCLTKHGTVIHTKQVVWDLEAPLGLWINETAVTQDKTDESKLYGSFRHELFKDCRGVPHVEFGSSGAVLCAMAQ